MKMLNTYKELNADEKQIIGGVIAFGLLFIGLLWLVSTTTPPVLDTPKEDLQTKSTYKKSYELPEFYNEYAQHCYDYGK